jgi:catechol 2,3-dioxygenase-like lactoylglutathione lyase family enzyme
MQLRLPMIFAKDMARMTAFYRDGIGLELVAERSNEWWTEFQAGGAMLALHKIAPDIADTIEITSPPRPRSSTPIKLIFETADLEASRAHLIEHGAVMFEPQPWGACDGLDPEGNVFQIMKV